MRTGVVALAACALAATAFAQGNPRGSATTDLGGKKVTVDYGRPALKGRNLDELMKQLPADRIWRAGENEVSTLETEGDLLVGGKKVPAGKYAVYVHAAENGAWDFVLNKELGVPLVQLWPQAPEPMKNRPFPRLQDYTKAAGATEVLRVPLKAGGAPQPAELFTISFAPKGQSQELTLAWGAQAWSVEIQPAR